MGRIITFDQSQITNYQLLNTNQQLVLVGGCFDILHIGHIHFLELAKKQGDILVVLLESDNAIKTKKGPHRPINTQEDRATILSSLRFMDTVILLPPSTRDEDYLNVTKWLKPAIIATTKGDPRRKEKEYCAQAVGAQVMDVIERQEDASTTHLAKLLQKDI